MGKKDREIVEKKQTGKTSKNEATPNEQVTALITLKNKEKKMDFLRLIDKISLVGSVVIIVIMVAILCFNIYRNDKDKPISYNVEDMEIENYNSIFEKYEGQYVKGSDIKQLINEIIDNNYKYIGQKDKFISIDASDMRHFTNNYLIAACTKSRFDNNQDNVNYATEQMKNFASVVDDSKMYSVFMEKTNNRITDIEIIEIQN